MPSCWKDVISPDAVIASFTVVLAVVAVWQTAIFVKTLRLARFQQRAWVGVTRVAATIAAGSPMKIVISFKNAGQGPALRVMRSSNLRLHRSTEPLRPDAVSARPMASAGLILPGEGQVEILYTPDLLRDEMLEEIKSGIVRVYVFGELTYSDILGRHRTRFFRFLEPSLSMWGIAETHNEMD